MTGDALINVEGLGVRYGSRNVLCNVHLTVRRGEFVAVVGKSGVGKSSLLYALAGYVPSAGRIIAPDRFGFVFQSYAVFPFLTVARNIGLGIHGTSAAERAEIVQRHLKLIELSDHADQYPTKLSGGQAQRVALARALAARPSPEVLYCDEPFGALDVFTRDRMQELLLKIWEHQQTACLFVTHSIDEAIFLASRVLVMKNRGLNGSFAVEFPRPRHSSLKFAAEFISLKKSILESMDA